VIDQRFERFAGDTLVDDVGLHVEIADGDAAQHVPAGKPRQDHLLHLEADDGGGSSPRAGSAPSSAAAWRDSGGNLVEKVAMPP
jgi:hypothetical protein